MIQRAFVFLFLLLAAALISPVVIQAEGLPDAERMDALANRHARDTWESLYSLLSIPNNALIADHVDRNVREMERIFSEQGFSVKHLETPVAPLLLAERPAASTDKNGAEKTVLVYLQIDGQPVDPSKWDQEDPWKPVLKEKDGEGWRTIPWNRLNEDNVDPEWRIFARASADAKGPVVMFLAALDACEREGFRIPYNLKVIMDFEEELGSPRLPAAVEKYREDLAADALIIFDGPRHATNRPSLYFGARGIATVTLQVFGPRVPQHSGHYGNYSPNPAMRLAQLLASMKDDEGRVTIPGFYDGVVLDEAAKKILAQVPDDEDEIRQRLGIAEPEGLAPNYQESIQYPSLNVRGLQSAWVGAEVRTVIPASAIAEIDVRLVKAVDPERLISLIRKHIEDQGYHLLENREPTDEERRRHPRLVSFFSEISYQAFQTDEQGETAQWLRRALTRGFNEEPVNIRLMGGSIPISPFVNTLGVPAVGVPGVQLDNNQHSPNENLRVGNYIDGIRTYLAVLTEPF